MKKTTFKISALAVSASLLAAPTFAQQVNAFCSTNQAWCELAATEFTKSTGIKVVQTHLGTGEALVRLKAEAANPKTDIWWGGTGDPFLAASEEKLLDQSPCVHQGFIRLECAPVRHERQHGRRVLHELYRHGLERRNARKKETRRAEMLG